MPESRYSVFRYSIVSDQGELVDPSNHMAEFEAVRGEKAPYRVSDPELHDYKNFIFDIVEVPAPDGVTAFSFGVGYKITSRVEHYLDPDTEKVTLQERPADDMRFTRGVFVPDLSVAAFRDGSGDSLAAASGIGRTKAIFDIYSQGEFGFEMTASAEEVEKAVANLQLVKMSFDVRPFNPHPANPGLELHELMNRAKVGKLTATATPFEGGQMTGDAGGLVSEVQGLTRKHYGHYGIVAKTDDGATVSYKKRPFKGDREKDQKEEEKPRLLNISVERGDHEINEEARVVKAILEIYGDEE